MTYGNLTRSATLSVMLFSAFLAGCGTTSPSRFYTLSPIREFAKPEAPPGNGTRFTVGVGPVEIPDYLERPHIVVRHGKNELIMAEYDRWAGSLKQDIARVLVQDLSLLLPPGATVLSWKRSIPLDYRVTVEVTSIDVIPGREVSLHGQWAVYGSEVKPPLTIRAAVFTEPLAGEDYPTTVSGIGKAVGQLSRAIAVDVTAARSADRGRPVTPEPTK